MNCDIRLCCLSIASQMQRMHSVTKSSKHEFMGPIDVKFCSIAFCLTVHVYGLLLPDHVVKSLKSLKNSQLHLDLFWREK